MSVRGCDQCVRCGPTRRAVARPRAQRCSRAIVATQCTLARNVATARCSASAHCVCAARPCGAAARLRRYATRAMRRCIGGVLLRVAARAVRRRHQRGRRRAQQARSAPWLQPVVLRCERLGTLSRNATGRTVAPRCHAHVVPCFHPSYHVAALPTSSRRACRTTARAAARESKCGVRSQACLSPLPLVCACMRA